MTPLPYEGSHVFWAPATTEILCIYRPAAAKDDAGPANAVYPVGGQLKSFDEYSQAFIIRFWMEPREIEDAAPVWRGTIEHVASGNRHYVNNLVEVEFIMASYLPDLACCVSTRKPSGGRCRDVDTDCGPNK